MILIMPPWRAWRKHAREPANSPRSVARARGLPGQLSVMSGDVAERTVREAALLLTFGSRPAIKQSLLKDSRQPGRTSA